MIAKMTFREIKNSLGRYLAIFAIVALGVGFFSGLKVCREAMVKTADEYLNGNVLFDYNLISSLGFSEDDISEIESIDKIHKVEGSKTADFIYLTDRKVEKVIKAISIPKNINKLSLIEGKMPANSEECLVDRREFTSKDIGKFIEIADINDADTKDKFTASKFKIVGLVTSPLYLNYERGATALGNGSVAAFIYLDDSSFATKEYSSIYATLSTKHRIYSHEYEDLVDEIKPVLRKKLSKLAEVRYEQLASNFPSGFPVSIEKPSTYVLTRRSNTGYVAFESDSSIVNGISKVFPLFFFLVAALVCMTTMTRMIDEKRTEIGIMKALGYSNTTVLSKYLFYAGSSAFLGSLIGFVAGSYVFPRVIWNAYGIMYDFNEDITFILDETLGMACILISVIGALAATFFSCESDFKIAPAQLIRPKAPKDGKRILLEIIPFIWNKFSFLYKVSFRNIFRYKKRFFMMIMGISGCTALVLTGFGINDSIRNIADFQFSEIMIYDYSVNFKADMTGREDEFLKDTDDYVKNAHFIQETAVDVLTKKKSEGVKLIVSSGDGFEDFVKLHDNYGDIKFPKEGQAVICQKLAETFDYKVGDKIKISNSEHKEMTLKISGICQNYVYNYVYISDLSYEEAYGIKPALKTALVSVKNLPENTVDNSKALETKIHKSAAKVMEHEDVLGVLVNRDMLNRVSNMMNSLDAVIALVILSAGALAFIVLYNLTNINITERIREIATIKVLGFYPLEIALYVFRENFFLTLMGAGLGLGLGKLLHSFVISQIKVDLIYFQTRVAWQSYIYAVLITLAFAVFVNFILYFKLNKISMTESLKAVE